jgi:hypothetical protein
MERHQPNLPHFLMVGTAKAGTQTLVGLMREHGNVYIPERAETNFFAFDSEYKKGMGYYARQHFAGVNGHALVGEKSWRYALAEVHPHALDRIRKHLRPDLKIVYVVRHPLERTESLWMEFRSSGAELLSADFNKAVRESQVLRFSSLYWSQINRYRECYPEESIRVLFFEDLKNDPQKVAGELFDFLGLERGPVAPDVDVRNKSLGKLQDGRLLQSLRRVPGFAALRDSLPRSIRKGLRSQFKTPLVRRPAWDADTKKWFLESIVPDSEKFLSHYRRPGLWTFS